MLSYQKIILSELPAFVSSEDFIKYKTIPITLRRAMAQTLNPRAKKDDVVLILLKKQSEIVGYIGILPDNFKENPELRFGWISCWWTQNNISPNAVLTLLLEALKSWDYKLMSTDMIPHTRKLLMQSGEFKMSPMKEGIRIYLRYALQEILPKKIKWTKVFKPFWRVFDTCLNFFLQNKQFDGVQDSINTEFIEVGLNDFIQQNFSLISKDELIGRGPEEIKWIFQNPWIGNTEKDWLEQKKYYFSSYTKSFENRFFQLKRNDEMLAFIWISCRNHHLKTPGVWVKQGAEDVLTEKIIHFSRINKFISITTFHSGLSKSINKLKKQFIYAKPQYNNLAYTESLAGSIKENAILQDGDGDYAFT